MSQRARKTVKEALDNLPSGVCFFDKNGMVTLCNHQMYRLVFALTGQDLQSLSEMLEILDGQRDGLHRKGDIFLLEDGSAWRFKKERVTIRSGESYTQITASDVTELYRRHQELKEDNRKLEEYAERMKRLSANIITLIREEEILNMKMRVHDDIGRSVIATRKLLKQGRPIQELDLESWKNAIRLLKHEKDSLEEKDATAQLQTAADSIGIRIFLDGEFPEDKEAANLLITAIRECMTNAVRHAGATELYARITCDHQTASAVITNNGAVPEREITEGGGLSSLRAHIRNREGRMEIQSAPRFALTVTVPIGGEERR